MTAEVVSAELVTANRMPSHPVKAEAVGSALVPLLRDFPQVLAAWQYGSSLRSDYRPGTSDIDILLIVTDDLDLDATVRLCDDVRARVPEAEVTVLRHAEVTAAIHPGWSRHFFINVSRSGRRLHGPDVLAGVVALPLSLDEAYQRLVQLTQRARLVCLNPSKSAEEAFWLGKYQHWIPLCLMELLELAGAPEDRLQQAHTTFLSRFPSVAASTAFPYHNLRDVTEFLEHLVRWVPEHAQHFDALAVVGSQGA